MADKGETVTLGEGLLMAVTRSTTATGDLQLLLHVRRESGGGAPDLMLHWGLLCAGDSAWHVPMLEALPQASHVYEHKAVQSPFYRDTRLGHAALTLIVPAGLRAHTLVFVLREGHNCWIKARGGHDFELPLARVKGITDELVRVVAYTKWETAGKPSLSQGSAFEMFEEALREIEEKVRSGVPLERIETELLGTAAIHAAPTQQIASSKVKADVSQLSDVPAPLTSQSCVSHLPPAAPAPVTPEPRVVVTPNLPREMVEVRAYVRWEEGGKRDLPPDEQQREFDRAAEEMWVELEAGASLQQLQEWLDKGPFGERPSAWLSKDPLVTYTRPSREPREKGVASARVAPELDLGIAPEGRTKGDPTPPQSPPQRLFACTAEEMLGAGGQRTAAAGVANSVVDAVAAREPDAERSFMHRYNIASELLQKAVTEGPAEVTAVAVWLRYAAAKLLLWNNDYNVKPRELSAAQMRLTDQAIGILSSCADLREIMRLIMVGVGRGGEGDVGQRIRDEILVIQRNNDQMGGMMEEWHQKLHNNTCPDDVAICQALMDHIESGFDMAVYWDTLRAHGIDHARLSSYDRSIVSEPDLKAAHGKPKKLYDDLAKYLRSLKAVHSGADLESAVEACLGYSLHQVKGNSASKDGVHAVVSDTALANALRDLVASMGADDVETHMTRCVDCRLRLMPLLRPGGELAGDALKDVVYLDLALENAFRADVERTLAYTGAWGMSGLARLVGLAIENCALSLPDNDEMVYCARDWLAASSSADDDAQGWALRIKAAGDRTAVALAEATGHTHALLQPSAEAIGSALRIDGKAVATFTEEVVRAGPGAPLSQLLARLDPVLRAAADLGAWQVIAPYEATGCVICVDFLETVMEEVYAEPAIIVAGRVSGEEEIPEGAVAVVTPDMPDVLSHVAVRARNEGVCFATCFDEGALSSLRAMAGSTVCLRPSGPNDLLVEEVSPAVIDARGTAAITGGNSSPEAAAVPRIERVSWCGSWALPWDEYREGMVGAKSNNVASLRGRLPDWIRLPVSAALPFGVFDELLKDPCNAMPAAELQALFTSAGVGQLSAAQLEQARAIAMRVRPTNTARAAIEAAMACAGLPVLADEGRWGAAFSAIARVWASKWNERAYVSCRKAGIDHSLLQMAVLIQEVVQPQYAFVLHTVNPVTGDAGEIYGELVCGLGETLVGNYPGRALSFSAPKSDLRSPRTLGFPSKAVALLCPETLIFRSDSKYVCANKIFYT